MKFKEPKKLNKPDNSFNGVVAVGIIQKIKNRDSVGKEIVRNFYEKVDRVDGSSFYVFQANLRCGDTIIRIRAFNSETEPTRAKNFAELVKEGERFKIEGRLSEKEVNDNIYREIIATKITKVTEGEETEDFAVVNLQGKISYIEYDETESSPLKIIVTMPNYKQELDEYRIVGLADNPYVEWLVNKNPAAEEGDSIKVGCFIKNELKRDLFGDVEEVINRLELVKITHYYSKAENVQPVNNAAKKRFF